MNGEMIPWEDADSCINSHFTMERGFWKDWLPETSGAQLFSFREHGSNVELSQIIYAIALYF